MVPPKDNFALAHNRFACVMCKPIEQHAVVCINSSSSMLMQPLRHGALKHTKLCKVQCVARSTHTLHE